MPEHHCGDRAGEIVIADMPDRHAADLVDRLDAAFQERSAHLRRAGLRSLRRNQQVHLEKPQASPIGLILLQNTFVDCHAEPWPLGNRKQSVVQDEWFVEKVVSERIVLPV